MSALRLRGGVAALLTLVALVLWSPLAAAQGCTVGASDSTPPIGGTVYDGIGKDEDVQVDNTTILNASWSGFSDPESCVVLYFLAIGTTPFGHDVRDFHSVGNVQSTYEDKLNLTPGTTYYITIRAYNGVGLTVEGTSDGIRVESSTGEVPDAGLPPDSGTPSPNAGTPDSGTPDSGTPDAGPDAGLPGTASDGGTAGDGGEMESPLGWGCSTGGTGGLALMALTALGLGVTRRSRR